MISTLPDFSACHNRSSKFTRIPNCHRIHHFYSSYPFVGYHFTDITCTFFKDDTHFTGGRASKWFRELLVWRAFANYFPVSLVKESELSPEKTYLFGYHPHGIYGTGAFVCFATEALGVSQVFPGLRTSLVGLDLLFKVPFYREIALAVGGISSSKVSLLNNLSKGPGSCCVVMIGGAQEALYTKPELATLILSKRYGFVKVAIQAGSSLVPVFGRELFYKKGSIFFKQVFGFSLPLFFGKGVYNYNFGILPRNLPITVVVGKPIDIQQDDNPSEEKVLSIHKQYMDALEDLYNRNKVKYYKAHKAPTLCFI
ncbi:diacylglycerol O-acyltransferase 1 [Entomophthora muscae]|uniref:Diacylglycerol O-acyltransferase 1 n=1 Tax=Entomophthora muscae TaxID=34485 RepID=A0ACC2RVJ2_9FUNG|nr:diacylglycerol O-acyltransferase 1 [Entomophthora muscae]